MKIETLPTYKDKKLKKNRIIFTVTLDIISCIVYRHKITTQKGEVISHTDIMWRIIISV